MARTRIRAGGPTSASHRLAPYGTSGTMASLRPASMAVRRLFVTSSRTTGGRYGDVSRRSSRARRLSMSILSPAMPAIQAASAMAHTWHFSSPYATASSASCSRTFPAVW